MTLPEYIKSVEINVNNYGGNGSIVYTASASSAMIYSYNLLCIYTTLSKRKNPPIPILVTSKSTDDLDEQEYFIKMYGNQMRCLAEGLFKLITCFYYEKIDHCIITII